MMTENSENDAKAMEVTPIFFICLDDNRVILIRLGFHCILKKITIL